MTGNMTQEERVCALMKLGAVNEDMDALLTYTENVFRKADNVMPGGEISPKWGAVWERVQALCAVLPRLEMYKSDAGIIPIVYAMNADDFEKLILEIVYKGKGYPHISDMGASFVYGKTLRFIILSGKPYSGIPAGDMGLSDANWLEKSTVIRKYHECAHFYTMRYYGSSRNNLHDELIADFCGLYSAFGQFRAEWFKRFFEVRRKVYTKDLSEAESCVIVKLAAAAADGVEVWTKTPEFQKLGDTQRIDYLAGKELLSYVSFT